MTLTEILIKLQNHEISLNESISLIQEEVKKVKGETPYKPDPRLMDFDLQVAGMDAYAEACDALLKRFGG